MNSSDRAALPGRVHIRGPAGSSARCEQFADAGAAEIGFGDTTGMANPAQVSEFFGAALARLPGVELTAHFHNTRGQGLANAYAALQVGCTSFESSFGELGGCPVPAGSKKVIGAARDARVILGRKLTSHSIVAGPVTWASPAAG